MKLAMRTTLGGVCAAIILGLAATAGLAQDYSHARIVRLSFVEGAVGVLRPDVDEWAEGLVNTPVQEGFKVSTAEDGFAEVEFENASTARVGQNSLLKFTQLALQPSGAKVNRLTLHQGYATFNFVPEDGDVYEITAGEATLAPNGKTRFRLDLEEGSLLVKVFKGSVEITSPQGAGTIGEDALLQFRPGEEPAFQIAQGISKDAWDEWVENREAAAMEARARRAPQAAPAGVSDLLFGFVDLALYGDWFSHPDYGSVWYPFSNRGWNPYTSGRWCWYPGYEYVWISSEPWGWLPYHYGRWVFDSRVNGWCWIPGDFTAWSPALVTWYRGPGWVGWAPRATPRLHGSRNDCRSPHGCGVAVSEETFRNGKPVQRGRILNINPEAHGRPLERPDLEPDRLARLPGEPYLRTGAPRRPQEASQIGPSEDGQVRVRSSQSRPGVYPASVSSSGQTGIVREKLPSSIGIVLDPEEHRYVNSSRPVNTTPDDRGAKTEAGSPDRTGPSPPARIVAGEDRSRGPIGSSISVSRPGPQRNNNYPAAMPARSEAAAGREPRQDPTGESSGDSSRIRGRGSNEVGAHIGTFGTRPSGGRSSDSSPSKPSGTVSRPRSENSSSSRISSGGSSDSRGGDGSSGRSSGDSGGSSGGGSHVSSRGGSDGDSSGGHSSSGGHPHR